VEEEIEERKKKGRKRERIIPKKKNLNCEEERSWIFGSLKWFILNQRVSLGRKKKERKKKNTNKKERKKP
jgi:hypothetical protein